MTEQATKQRGAYHKPQCSPHCAIRHCKCGRNAAHGSNKCSVCLAKESGPFVGYEQKRELAEQVVDAIQARHEQATGEDAEVLVSAFSPVTEGQRRHLTTAIHQLNVDVADILTQYRLDARGIIDDLEDRLDARIKKFEDDMDAA